MRKYDRQHTVCQIAISIEDWIKRTVSDHNVKIQRHSMDSWNVCGNYFVADRSTPSGKRQTFYMIRCTPTRAYFIPEHATRTIYPVDYADPDLFRHLYNYVILKQYGQNVPPVTDDPELPQWCR